MAISALQKFFIPPVFASLAAFSVMTVPLGLLGDKVIEIKLEEEPFFYGKLREGAIAYVIGATAISLGAGISVAALSGWRNSARNSLKTEEKLSNLEQHLQDKEELIKELKLSESRLQISGLHSFLDEEVPFNPTLNADSQVSQPVVAQAPIQIYQSPTISSSIDALEKHTTSSTQHQAIQELTNYPQTAETTSKLKSSVIKSSDIEQLQKQIEQMMLQMQAMQDNLTAQTPTQQIENTKDKFKVYYDTPSVNEAWVKKC